MYIKINGIDLFYEVKGQGDPLILLHGNGEDHTIFDVLSEGLSQNHTVYTIDSRDHGKSEITKDLSYNLMMEDTAGFIKALNIENPILFGFSDGGITGLLLASKYPDMLSKLIISGANLRPDGIKFVYIAIMKIIYFFSHKRKIKMMLTEPDIKQSDLDKIIVPVLVLAGSKDVVKEEHTKEIAAGLKRGVLKILEGENHASYVINSKKLYGVIKDFLEEKEGVK